MKTAKKSAAFSAEELAAMRERTAEAKTAGADPEAALLAKIVAMPEKDRALAERLHAVVSSTLPELKPTTWYGMPAYTKAGKVVCFFQGAYKFKTRYATLGFSDKAKLDAGGLWPTAFALKEWTPAVEKQITALLQRAVG